MKHLFRSLLADDQSWGLLLAGIALLFLFAITY